MSAENLTFQRCEIDNVPTTASDAGKAEKIDKQNVMLESILVSPDTYIGSTDKDTRSLWVWENKEMVHKSISYVPGLYKIFDEILVKVADNMQKDQLMNSIKVMVDPKKNLISVYNNGYGIPVEIHKERDYVPEMIFGDLLAGTCYDSVEKTPGGNEYGVKLTNIFSEEFVIKIADGRRQKKYTQDFSCNMSKKSKPVITECEVSENWTMVTFKPDLKRFNMTHLEDDVVALMSKRVVDLAGCLGETVTVELNENMIPVKSFSDYVNLYPQPASKSRHEALPRTTEKVNDRWEICVSLSEGLFQQVSFVNSIATINGGSHVDYVTNQISSHVMNHVNNNKNANLESHTVKNHLWVFVNALIDNPTFDSQIKETLTIQESNFGSKCELSEEFLMKVVESLPWEDFKQRKDIEKTDGAKKERIIGIPKLEDAHEAGGKNSAECTLILTEGDSAKSLAMAGIAVVGRDHYGVFPLSGKLLNVREASPKQITKNAEIQSLKQILGLELGKDYDNDSVKSLRYGHLMIMTDQDHDGSHIKGLLINCIHTLWPSLLKIPGFMIDFITPIVRDHDGSHIKGLLINCIHTLWPSLLKIPGFMIDFITPIVRARRDGGEVLSFYGMPEYKKWKSDPSNASGWTIKYHKGLGTSTCTEGIQYFQQLDKHRKEFIWEDDDDKDVIELPFSKEKIEARKKWLTQQVPTSRDMMEKKIYFKDFVNCDLLRFSVANLQRTIPSMVDGLKTGQRKILFSSFKRNLVEEVKVAQFAGYVSEHTDYRHGEAGLADTIIGMAQDFVGSNNINLLKPIGQFGTRNQGGKDHARPKCIYTQLSPITRFLFPKDDEFILPACLNDDGQSIEPFW